MFSFWQPWFFHNLRGDGRYNPRNVQFAYYRGRLFVRGVCIDDGSPAGSPKLPDRPFILNLPWWFKDWVWASVKLILALQQPGLMQITY